MSASVLIAGPESIGRLLNDISNSVTEAGFAVTVTHQPILSLPPLMLAEVQALICVVSPVGRAELDALPNVRALISPITGYDWIDLEAAGAKDVLVVNGEASENFESMAEATIMLMLTSLYDLHGAEKQLRELQPRPKGPMSARMVSGKTIGIIGYGNISRAIIRRLAGWDAQILVTTRTPPEAVDGIRFVELDRLLEASDVVIVMTSLAPETRNLLDAARLRRLKPGCVFINTARGGLVDEQELCRQVATGRISKAALDVFDSEPLGADSPLRQLPNTILTDHIVGHTREMYDAIPRIAAVNVAETIGGTPPERTRNRDVVERGRAKWGPVAAGAEESKASRT